ncbi:MAG: iron-containing alcohol dehydrogenase family protein [Bacteroidia bacterium]|nr:iron-containing alcohol dehydrogenase family protein [Bacteroidia bacterium]
MKNSKLVQYYIIGSGSINELELLLSFKRENSNSYVVFLIDHFFKSISLTNKLPILENDTVIFVDTTNEPHSEYIDGIIETLKIKAIRPSVIIGIGGGSTLDIAKAISILLTNPGSAEDYQGWDLVKNAPIYKIGIPTIAGTGAEFTRTAVMTSKTKKLGINSDHSVYDQVILDPDLLTTVPNEQFIYTAMDCYVHNVESLRGSQNDEMTIAFAEKSLNMMEEIFLGEMNLEKLQVASAMGGIAIANSNVGICHPLSYGLSLVLNLHHGFSICIAFNQLAEYYPEVSKFKEILEKYNVRLPKIITPEISLEQINRIADATLKNERPLENAFGKNWRSIFTKEKVIELIKKM